MRLNNDTYLNILVSYAYVGNAKGFLDNVIHQSKKGYMNFMLDSGAFTLFNSKKKLDFLTINNYIEFIKRYEQHFEKYVMLDVIGDHLKSKENYEYMVSNGVNPMFVYTMQDNDLNYLKDATNNNKNICVAGGVTTKGEWMSKRFQDVYLKTNGLIHGLGYVTYPKILQLPLHSVDSSSWTQSSQVYGVLNYFDNGLKSISYMDILKRKKVLPIQLKKIFENVGITPQIFSNLENHKGSSSIASMINIIAYIEYQKVCKRQGLDLFLAVSNDTQLNQIIHVDSELNNNSLSYLKYKKRGLCKKK